MLNRWKKDVTLCSRTPFSGGECVSVAKPYPTDAAKNGRKFVQL